MTQSTVFPKDRPVGHRYSRPFFTELDLADYARLEREFPDLALLDSVRYLALRPLIEKCPDRFFDRQSFSLYLDWLKARDACAREALQAHFLDSSSKHDTALQALRQINAEGWHDDLLRSGDDYSRMSLIDKVVHPAYLRLSEGVLAPFIRSVAYFSRLDREKGTEKLDIYNLVEELSGTPFHSCVTHYNHIVRNAISHGGVTFLSDGIRYEDKKGGSKIINARDVVRLFDDMLDVCNGLAAAFKIFLLTHNDVGYKLPRELLIEEIQEDTRSPWWRVDGCLDSEISSGSQLIIYARPNSNDHLKIYWFSIYTAMMAELLTPGYKRYFISLGSRNSSLGWAAFDGEKIAEIRLSGAQYAHEYVSALADTGFLYSVRRLPRFFAKAETLIGVMGAYSNLIRDNFLSAIRAPRLVCRRATIHRNAWGYVLNGSVVISPLDGHSLSTVIRKNRRRIIRLAASNAKSSVSRFELERYLPLGFARISVYSEDFRRRRFDSFGLGPQLVCTIQLKRIRRIRTVDISWSTVEVDGNWRIAWNRAWLENGGDLQGER